MESPKSDTKYSGGLIRRLSRSSSGENESRDPASSPELHSRERRGSLKPHNFRVKSYISPTWCAVCNGILVGLFNQGMQCTGCKLNCHRGEGRGEHRNCRAEALMTPCTEETVKPQKGDLNLGDLTAQVARDARTLLREGVMKATVDDNKPSLDKLSTTVQSWKSKLGDHAKVARWILWGQVASIGALLVWTFSMVMLHLLAMEGIPKDAKTALLHVELCFWTAMSACVLGQLAEIGVLVGFWCAAEALGRYSAMIHEFCIEIIQVDLNERFGIDTPSLALWTKLVVQECFYINCGCLFVTWAVWAKLIPTNCLS